MVTKRMFRAHLDVRQRFAANRADRARLLFGLLTQTKTQKKLCGADAFRFADQNKANRR